MRTFKPMLVGGWLRNLLAKTCKHCKRKVRDGADLVVARPYACEYAKHLPYVLSAIIFFANPAAKLKKLK